MTSEVMGDRRVWLYAPRMLVEGFSTRLKQWRTIRRLSQEQLAADAEISARHLSYLETGKSKPSREMVLVLASALELELRDRNVLLGAAGFAPVYANSGLTSLVMEPVRRAIDLLLEKQEPYGAVLVDRCWNVLRLNRGGQRLFGRFVDLGNAPPAVMSNLIKGAMHPDGLRPAIVNWPEVAAFTLDRLDRECAMFPADEERRALRAEVLRYPGVPTAGHLPPAGGAPMGVVHLRRGPHEVRLFTMLTTIGTPLDVTAQELMLESYFPADDETARWFEAP